MSEEHLERRRQQILDAARACFIRKGFHETSMQDIFAEANLSAGAVYRYFKSKNEIIEAIAAEALSVLGAVLHEIAAEQPPPSPDEAVERVATKVVEIGESHLGTFVLAPHAWALAMQDAGFKEYVQGAMAPVRALWTTYAENLRDSGRIPQDADPDAVGRTLLALLPGFIIQRGILGDVAPETLGEGLRALMSVAPASDRPS